MEVPLTPLEFFRRARCLYGGKPAVVDGPLRLTYAEFGDRCARWSAWLQKAGVRKGDRVAYIAPNVHAQLESFYAVPQIGAVLVPLNYRLIADDFRYLITHSGAKVVCAHADYLECVDGIRKDLPAVEHFIALTGAREGWLDRRRTDGPATSGRSGGEPHTRFSLGAWSAPKAGGGPRTSDLSKEPQKGLDVL